MNPRQTSPVAWARRLVQTAVLLAFVGLAVQAGLHPTEDPSPALKTFFWLDPFVLLATGLATHAWAPTLLWGLLAVGAILAAAAVARRLTPGMALMLMLAAVAAALSATSLVKWLVLREPTAADAPAEGLAETVQGWTALPGGLFWAIGILLATMLLGRVFCGWICPLGAIHALAGRVADWWQPPAKRREHWSPWQRTKYFLLVAFLAMALLGGHWGTIFDPLVLLYRTTITVLLPGTQWAVEEGSTAIYRADPGVGPARLKTATEPVYRFLSQSIFVNPRHAFLGTGAIAALLVLTLALNAYRRRWWCRYVCPLGALLGLFAWRPLLRRVVRQEGCNHCDLCGMNCAGAAAAAPGQGWKPSECFGCLQCSGSCPKGSLEFQVNVPWRQDASTEAVDLSKRAVLLSALGGVLGLAVLRATPQGRGRAFNPNLVRPPGALEESEFLRRCTACGLCVKACVTGGLQPCWGEAGLEGLWTPRLVARIAAATIPATVADRCVPPAPFNPCRSPRNNR